LLLQFPSFTVLGKNTKVSPCPQKESLQKRKIYQKIKNETFLLTLFAIALSYTEKDGNEVKPARTDFGLAWLGMNVSMVG
jgi:hypothetical protein